MSCFFLPWVGVGGKIEDGKEDRGHTRLALDIQRGDRLMYYYTYCGGRGGCIT